VSLMTGAEPFSRDGGSMGVVLCHGFTGSPAAMRPWAEFLAAAGLSVRLPRLPGHGTRWQDLALTRWQDWYATIDRAFVDLRGSCTDVFVTGLSMGGTLALRLAEQRGSEVAGLVLVNPSLMSLRRAFHALPVLARVVPSVRGITNDVAKPGVAERGYDRVPLPALRSLTELWRSTRADLASVEQPILVFRSSVDHVVEPENTALLLRDVTSADVEERVLSNSFHVATLDHDAPTIFRESLDFMRRVGAAHRFVVQD
jgi:carboxylesterase